MTIHSANIHMHSYGKQAVSYLQGPQERQVLIEIPRWDLNWQTNFYYQQPLQISYERAKEVTINVDCEFYNPQDYAIVGGFGSDDEMCFNFFYTTFE